MKTYKVWALMKLSYDAGDEYSHPIQMIDFDVLGTEPQVMTEEEYRDFCEGRAQLLLYKRHEFIFIVHEVDDAPLDKDVLTTQNVVSKCIESGIKRRVMAEARRKKADEKLKKASEKRLLQEKKKYEELKKKFDG